MMAGALVGERPSAAARAPLRAQIDDDLDTITLVATRSEPARRYASVDRLSEDVQRWLDGLPIRARPDTVAYRARRFVRRNRAGVALALTLATSLIVFVLLTVVHAGRVEQERDRARLIITLLADLLDQPASGMTANPAVPARAWNAREQSVLAAAAPAGVAELEQLATRLYAGSVVLRRADLARAAAAGARILWVDDNPEANRYETMLFHSLGAEVVAVQSTEEAQQRIMSEQWDVVLSDMSRHGRADEGLHFLAWLRTQDAPPRLIFYVGDADPARDRPLGSFGLTNRPDEMIHLVFDVLERRRL